METPSAQLGLGDVIKLKPVQRLWMAQVVSIFGDFLAIFAVISVVTYQLKGTPAQVTLISIAFMLPFALISPVAGVFVDRWNVKRKTAVAVPGWFRLCVSSHAGFPLQGRRIGG